MNQIHGLNIFAVGSSFSDKYSTLLISDTGMQMLQTWVSAFVDIIRGSTRRMPYGMRYLVRETLGALRVCRICPLIAIFIEPTSRRGSQMDLKRFT